MTGYAHFRYPSMPVRCCLCAPWLPHRRALPHLCTVPKLAFQPKVQYPLYASHIHPHHARGSDFNNVVSGIVATPAPTCTSARSKCKPLLCVNLWVRWLTIAGTLTSAERRDGACCMVHELPSRLSAMLHRPRRLFASSRMTRSYQSL